MPRRANGLARHDHQANLSCLGGSCGPWASGLAGPWRAARLAIYMWRGVVWDAEVGYVGMDVQRFNLK
jgi:hypothetical protein